MNYAVVAITDTFVQLRKVGENNTFNYEIRNIILFNGLVASKSDLMVGDRLWVDQSNYLHLYEFSSNRISPSKSYLKDSNVPKYLLEEFPYIRVMEPQTGNIKFITSVRILELTFTSRDSLHVEKIREICPNLSQVCNFFLTKISLNSATQAMNESIVYPDHILSLFNNPCEKFQNNFESVFNIFGFKVRIFDLSGRIENIFNIGGKVEINYLKIGEIYHILYAEHEKEAIYNPESITFTKAYLAIDKYSNKSHFFREEKEKLDKNVFFLKEFIESLIRDMIKQRIVLPLLQLSIFFLGNGINKELFQGLTCENCSQTEDLISISCKHKFCHLCFEELVASKTSGLMVLNDYEKSSEITCSLCSSLITMKHLEENLINFERYKKNAEERAVLTCKKCENEKNRTFFYSSCRHACRDCQAENIRADIKKCDFCDSLVSNEEVQRFLDMDARCDSCFEEFKLLKQFGKKLCNHYFCLTCYEDEDLKKEQKCFIEDKSFNISRAEYAMIFKVKCKMCPDLINVRSKYWREKNCQCPICESCLFSNKEYLEEKKNCPICKTEFNEQAFKCIENLYEEKKNRDKIKVGCPICFEDKPMDTIIDFFMCGHKICKGCFSQAIDVYFKDISKIDLVRKCSVCQEVDIDPCQLESLLNPDQNEKLNIISAQTCGGEILECPKCRERFELNMVRKVSCVNKECNYTFCKQCKEPYHENGDCEDVFIQQRIEMLSSDPGGVTQCPKCRWPYIKNQDTCAHATCINPKCGIDFCFTCACIRSPTLEHGNHYHRPDCLYYSDYDGRDDKMSDKCSECVIHQGLCPKPRRLNTPRLVTKEEAS